MQLMYLVFVLDIALVSSTDDSCREGWYGVDCGLQCSDTCRPLNTFPCNKDTGKCSEGCKRGYYGPQCESNCPCTGPCIQDTGDCIGQQTQSTAQTTSQSTIQSTTRPIHQPKPQPCPGQDEEELKLWKIMAIVSFIIIALLLLVVVLYVLKKRRTTTNAPHLADVTEMHDTEKPLIAKNRYEKIIQQLEDSKAKIKKLEEQQEKEHNTALKNCGLRQNSSYYLMKASELKMSAFLQCPWLKFDPGKINVSAATLDGDRKLSNTPNTSPPHQQRSLIQYSGTTTSDPLQATGSAQYWEVESDIAFIEPVAEGEVLLDFGFCNDEDRDKAKFTPERKPCCSLKVVNCSIHKKICLKVFSESKVVLDHQTEVVTANDTRATTFKCGFLLHRDRKKITFLDIENMKIIHSATLDSKSKWPMFGLGAQRRTDIHITLVSGNAITMTDDKNGMLKKLL